jgi:thiol-disulfide isomerase/thioredoxin
VRQALKEKLSTDMLDKMKWADRAATMHRVLDGLIAQYPRELEPYIRLINFDRYDNVDEFTKLQTRYRDQAKQHPDDPLALYLAGVVLFRTDTPESIRLEEAAKSKAPDFAWPNLELANIYSLGKHADKEKSTEYLAAFFAACPGSTDSTAQRLLAVVGDAALQARVAASLRAQLSAATDPEHLKQYETLWGLEFRSRPPQEHAALRQQVTADLKRLESLNPKPDADWMALLKKGYKQSGASDAMLTAFDDRILKEYPSSQAAYDVAYQRWKKAHKEPEDQKDATAWAAYNQVYKEAVKSWIHDFTEDSYLQRSTWFYTIFYDYSISEKEGMTALDHFLKAETDYDAPASSPYQDWAEFLLEHKWQPKRALELLRKAQPLLAKEIDRDAQDDNIPPDKVEENENYQVYRQQSFAGLTLRAARMAGRLGDAQALRASIEGPAPKGKKRVSDYWLNRARLATLENRKADGLTYYQLALITRVSPPTPWHGILEDNVTDEAHALFNEIGGTEVAWAAWSQPPTAKLQELAEDRWEKPKRQIPAFELADLSGKTWKLKTLEGKSVLINLWATWCGPCNAELPHLQKFYEKVKDRTDFQVLTFNLDQDLGLVEPFMKEKGYTFPVLPAFSLVVNLLDGGAIPQNWVVDPQGSWRWTQLGFDGASDWIDSMIQRLESVKKSEGAL